MDPQIHEWQKAILPNPSTEESIGIAKVFSDCSDLWGLVTRILTRQQWVPKSTIRKLDSAHSYFRLWANGYDILSGQFEKRLKNSQRAGDLTIRLLQNICRTLAQELTPVIAALSTVQSQDATGLSLAAADLALTSERLAVLVQEDNDSDTSEDGEAVVSSESVPHEKLLDDIADDLRNDTQCLLDLGPRFEEQVTNPIVNEAAANPLSSTDGGLSDTFTERIIRVYPQCESNLAGRLGKANWLRFLKISDCKSRTSEGQVIQDSNNDKTCDITENESVGLGSMIDILSTRQSIFHDSGVGTASTVSVSHPAENLLQPKLRDYPPPPDSALQGKPFWCPTCKFRVTITDEKEWRSHLIRDIEPYVCPEIECDAYFSSSLERWEKHVRNNHRTSVIWDDSKCRICGKDAYTKDMIIAHLANHMEAIALAIIPHRPSVEVDKTLATDHHEKKEPLTLGGNKSRDQKPKIRTGCNPCKMRRIKCDEKRPSCGPCARSRRVCEGNPLPPRPREVGTGGTPLGLSSPPAQPHDVETGNIKGPDSNEEWFSLFPDTSVPTLPLGSQTSASINIEGDPKDPSPGDDFVKPPLPSSSPRPLFSEFDTRRTSSWDEPLLPVAPQHEPPSLVPGSTSSYPRPDITQNPATTDPSVPSRRRNRPLPLIVVDPEQVIVMKRARNTLAARKSRERKFQRLEELEERIAKLEQERDKWKNVAMKHGAELP